MARYSLLKGMPKALRHYGGVVDTKVMQPRTRAGNTMSASRTAEKTAPGSYPTTTFNGAKVANVAPPMPRTKAVYTKPKTTAMVAKPPAHRPAKATKSTKNKLGFFARNKGVNEAKALARMKKASRK